ncbi:Peroxisome biogenesis protein 12 [Porphyridium purpureum]|uniref:Peroxin-12 n=1 Tax=Porphyridium purpureum TaxID=35688 RepID=A0A5J4Z9K6_PORPP|nr:Peroxisome biogenesis protein 12 [Porphyridium purpureum]|eukprot:POR9263..scf295_1
MFLTSIGSGDLRPSYFEMYAQHQIILSLRAALKYTLEVLALRHAVLFRVLPRTEELFLALHLIVQTNSLLGSHGTVTEVFYNLRRESVSACLRRAAASRMNAASSGQSTASRGASAHLGSDDVFMDGGDTRGAPLTALQVATSLLTEVGVPYVRIKLDALYERLTGGAVARLLGSTAHHLHQQEADPASSSRLQRLAKRWFVLLYPILATTYDITSVGYNLAYLFGLTKHFSFLLRLQNLVVRRQSISELREAQNSSGDERAPQGVGAKTLSVLDKAISSLKIALIVGVFVYKFGEYYYAEQKRQSAETSTVPGPPRALAPSSSASARALPSSSDTCPLCLKQRSNPAACGASGYVFCYECLFQAIQQTGKCPQATLILPVMDLKQALQPSSVRRVRLCFLLRVSLSGHSANGQMPCHAPSYQSGRYAAHI